MKTTLMCWKCGTSLEALPYPLSRLAECPACRAELHICQMCEFYDPRVNRSCREPIADEVKDKQRANFCGYFRIRPNAYQARDPILQHTAYAQLEALFGGTPTMQQAPAHAETIQEQLEKLFYEKEDQKK